MNRLFVAIISSALIALTTPAFAQKLKIVTSIPPIASLVAAIAADKADISILVPAHTSPHNFSLKPSDAKSLQNADLVFWVDGNLEVFLKKANVTLPNSALIIALADQPGVTVLNAREIELAQQHATDDEHDDNQNEHHDHEGHEHAEHDLHIWLDPINAQNIARSIEQALRTIDPENADHYRKNLNGTITKLADLNNATAQRLAPVSEVNFITFHDAFQYFEQRYALKNVGIVALNPETKPGAKRLVDLKSTLQNNNVGCLFSEPQFDRKLVQLAAEGTNVTTAELDAMGVQIGSGPNLYFELIENLTEDIYRCLSQSQ